MHVFVSLFVHISVVFTDVDDEYEDEGEAEEGFSDLIVSSEWKSNSPNNWIGNKPTLVVRFCDSVGSCLTKLLLTISGERDEDAVGDDISVSRLESNVLSEYVLYTPTPFLT